MRHNIIMQNKSTRDCYYKIVCILISVFLINAILCLVPVSAKPNKRNAVKNKEAIADNRDNKEIKENKEDVSTNEEGKDKTATEKKEVKEPPLKEYKDEDFMPKVEEESTAWMIFKVIIIIGLLVGGFYYFFRFVTKKAGIQVIGSDMIQVLSIVPLGQNKYLQVVDLAGKILVLGVSDNGINLISEITGKDEIDRLRLMGSRVTYAKEGGFQEYIMKHLGKIIEKVTERRNKGKKYTAESDESSVDLDYLKKQRNRLKNLNGFGDE